MEERPCEEVRWSRVATRALGRGWLAVAAAACHGAPEGAGPLPPDPPASPAPTTQEAAGGGQDTALGIPVGITLRSPEDHAVGLRLRLPVTVGISDFELEEGLSPDQLKTVAFVPKLEFVLRLDDEWTLLPYLGLGGAWLLDEQKTIGIISSGVRAELWHPFAEHYVLGFFPGVRYDVNLTRRDGVVGDWGRFELPLELRRTFGRLDQDSPEPSPRFQPGLYMQAFHYWDPIELQVPGIAPATVDDELELGFSLGSTPAVRVLGLPLPRVYIGFRAGDGLQGLRVRFGQI
jgi:hypothetical protein